MVRAARRVTAAEADEAHREASCAGHWDDDDGCLHDRREAAARGRRDLPASARGGSRLARPAARRARRRCTRARATVPRNRRPMPVPRSRRACPAAVADQRRIAAALCEAALARPPTGLHRRRALPSCSSTSTPPRSRPIAGRERGGPGACAIADGPGIAPETARRLACDSSIVRDHRARRRNAERRPSNPLDPTLRSPGARRPRRRCQFPGCERHRFVDAHHIRHWARGGATEPRQPRPALPPPPPCSSTRAASRSRSTLAVGSLQRPAGVEVSVSPAAPSRRPAAPLRPASVLTRRDRREDGPRFVHRCRPRCDRGDRGPTAPAARAAGAPG